MAWSDATTKLANSVVGAFGQSVTYTATGQSPITISKAVFDAEYTSVDLIDGVAVESKRPILTVASSDVAAVTPQQGDVCNISSTNYTVKNVRPDSQNKTIIFDLFKSS